MILTPAQQCFLYGHRLELVHHEPEDYPQRAPRLVCARCDAECTSPAAIEQWKGMVAERFIDYEIPRFISEAV